MLHFKRIFLSLCIILIAGCTNIPEQYDQTDASTTSDELYTTHQDNKVISQLEKQNENIQSSTEQDNPDRISAETSIPDIWQRIKQQLTLERNLDKKSVKNKLAWYARNQDYLDRVAERASPYIYHIVKTVEERNLPLELALLPIVESAYHPFAYSPSHASGIWQFIPGTGRIYGLKQNWWYDGRRDILAATDAALNYLEKLHKEFNGDWLLALAAYNTGERNVARAIARNKKAGKPVDFWSLRLHRETRGYVPSLLAVSEIIANPEKYQISLKPIINEPYFAKVEIGNQIDLSLVSDLSGLTMDEIYTLNPAMNQWATDPDGPHYLLLPTNKITSFEQQLKSLPVEERIKWQRHNINKGETLSGIASRYHTDVNTLKKINNLGGNMIRAGRSLLIPIAQQPLKNYTLSLESRKFRGLKRSNDGKQYLYTIRRGDTLWDIGNHYGISVNQLCAWNNITAKTILRPGKKLAVWVKETRENESEIVQVAINEISDNSKFISYTVKQGDSLWKISRHYGVSVKEIQKWNSLDKKAVLIPGQNLDIYIGKPPTDA